MLIDLSSDKGLAHFHAINKVLNLPEFVKQADFQEQIETDTLPREAFADPAERKFPIHTKAAAYISYTYFVKQAGNLDSKTQLRCSTGFDKAAQFWGLAHEFKDIAKAMAAPVEKAAADNRITPTYVLKQADALAANPGQYTFEERNHMAKELMQDAVALGLPVSVLPESVHKMAGFGITTKEAALIELTRRYDTEHRPALAQPLKACIDALHGTSARLIGGDVCEKIAKIIDRYDRMTPGAQSFPETVLFAFTKEAATKLAGKIVTLVDGTSYLVESFEKHADALNVLADTVDLVSLRNLDGSWNLTKVAEMVETLPRSEADMLKMAMNMVGVAPVTLDKYAMVKAAVDLVHDRPAFTVVQKPSEKRSDVLARLEAQDPLVRRALDTIRNLKTAGDKKDEEKAEKKSPSARGIGGLFIRHAPNSSEASPVK